MLIFNDLGLIDKKEQLTLSIDRTKRKFEKQK